MKRGSSPLALLALLAACSQSASPPATARADASVPEGPPYKAEWSPQTFLRSDCLSMINAFDPELGTYCHTLFDRQDPPLSYEDCVKQSAALDPERGPGFCAFLYPLAGYSSDSPIIGPNWYVEMPDGTLIATFIKMPKGYVAGRKYPVVIEMSGYESGSDDGATVSGDFAGMTGLPTPLQGGTRAAHGKFYEDDYVSITASVRGTGCSSGEFDLFSPVSALDGYHLVEWAAAQNWSNGDVGLFGHSYSGITAAHIAALQPPHLRVISISGLVGDVYRDITYPGGLTNYGFPLLWTAGVRIAYDVLGGSLAGLLADNGNRQCLRNMATHSRTVLEDPLLNGLSDYDTGWYHDRSVVYKAHDINVPTQITVGYQDEQTGPRGAFNIYDHLSPDIPKRLVMLNGNHDSQAQRPETIADRKAWLDYWLLGTPNPFVDPRKQRESTRVLLEMHDPQGNEQDVSNGQIDSAGFPLKETQWTDWYLQPGGVIAPAKPSADGGYTDYFNGSKRQTYSYQAGVNAGGEFTSAHAPDEAMFVSEVFTAPMVIAGPITADLFLKAVPADIPAATPLPMDLEFMVQLLDEGPGGELSYLQRGLLRAADRAIDPLLSQYTNQGRIYRPYRPHKGPVHDLFPSGEELDLLVELFPVGHVFRPGHRLVVKIHAPAIDDNDYTYIPKAPPSIVSLFHDAEHPSSLMLPVIPLSSVKNLGPDPGPCGNARVRCVKPGA